MSWLLLLTLPPAALFYYACPAWWAERDAADFSRNPADDTFHGKFHRQRMVWRAITMVAVSLLASLPILEDSAVSYLFGAAGLLVMGGAYFFYCFNPTLNEARNLPYVAKYYVSPDPAAAFFPDRYLWQKARAAYPAASNAYVQQMAGELLQRLLRRVLLAGCLLGALLWLAAYLAG